MPGIKKSLPPAAVYEIRVRGSLEESWSEWFSGMKILPDASGSGSQMFTLTGPIVDQPALRGILIRLWDMNFEIISFQQAPPLPDHEEQDKR